MSGQQVNFLGDIQGRLASARDVDARWQILVEALGACCGADQINYALLSPPVGKDGDDAVMFRSTMRQDWIAYYADRRFDRHDPHVKELTSGRFTPYLWSEDCLPRVTDPHERQVACEGIAAGMRAQIHLVLPDPLSGRMPAGGMALGSSSSPREFHKAIAGLETALISAAMLFHHYSYGELRREQMGIKPLSKREAECLSLIAAGHRVDAIAHKLRLATQTVELHLRNARSKLKSRTTPQAVARALLCGDISL